MKLDLGCGRNKYPNFYGIDKHNLPGVDLVWDMNQGLPLPDDSVEFIMACRSLPYVNDLRFLLSEIYRVCIHKAIVCILAPYAHNFRHLSHPYFKQRFDEYTPRYVTDDFFQPPGSPPCPANATYAERGLPFQFKLLRMEFFYQAPYHPPLYEQEELETLREQQANVVSEIMYHFVTAKQEIGYDELVWLSRQRYEEPFCVQKLRNTEEQEPPSDSTDSGDLTVFEQIKPGDTAFYPGLSTVTPSTEAPDSSMDQGSAVPCNRKRKAAGRTRRSNKRE